MGDPLIKGPCSICGKTGYQLSCGGPTICPSCDCGVTRDPSLLSEREDWEKEYDAHIQDPYYQKEFKRWVYAILEDRHRWVKAYENIYVLQAKKTIPVTVNLVNLKQSQWRLTPRFWEFLGTALVVEFLLLGALYLATLWGIK